MNGETAGPVRIDWIASYSHAMIADLDLLKFLRFAHAACCLLVQVFLIFGKSGWIGGLVGDLLKQQGARFEYASCRLEDRAAIISEIERVSSRPSELTQIFVQDLGFDPRNR
jgi:hypothetical protein